MNGKLLFCGTETASQFPGYMEGAVDAAIRVAEMIK
jgi:monoamine oxidase